MPSTLGNRKEKSGVSDVLIGTQERLRTRDLQSIGHTLANIQVNTALSQCSEFAASDKQEDTGACRPQASRVQLA